MNDTYFYRYDDYLEHYDYYHLIPVVKIILKKFKVIKKTDCGAWVQKYEENQLFPDFCSDKRFVLLRARKKFAYPTIEEAKESFIKRKTSQIRIVKKQLQRAEIALEEVKKL